MARLMDKQGVPLRVDMVKTNGTRSGATSKAGSAKADLGKALMKNDQYPGYFTLR